MESFRCILLEVKRVRTRKYKRVCIDQGAEFRSERNSTFYTQRRAYTADLYGRELRRTRMDHPRAKRETSSLGAIIWSNHWQFARAAKFGFLIVRQWALFSPRRGAPSKHCIKSADFHVERCTDLVIWSYLYWTVFSARQTNSIKWRSQCEST